MKIMMLVGMMFLWGAQPIYMMLSLIMVVLGYSLCIYYVTGSYWFSYIILLVLLSGVLVLFSYMLSFSPNISFEISSLVGVIIFMYFMYFCGGLKDLFSNFSILSLSVWGQYIGGITIYLVFFLLSIMVLVVWVSSMWGSVVKGLFCAWLKG